MTITIDKHSALSHLRAVVEEFGPEHEENCWYANIRDLHPRPGCIVGQVFARVGVSAETLHELDGSGTGSEGTDIASLATRGVLKAHGIDLTPDAVLILKAAQRKQDAGYNWGQALDEAEEKAAALPGAFYGPGQADCVACQGDVVTA